MLSLVISPSRFADSQGQPGHGKLYSPFPAQLLPSPLQRGCLSISSWVLIHRGWLVPLASAGSCRQTLPGVPGLTPSIRAPRGKRGVGSYAYAGCTNPAAEVKAVRNYWLFSVDIPIMELLGISFPKWHYEHRKGFTSPEIVLQAESLRPKELLYSKLLYFQSLSDTGRSCGDEGLFGKTLTTNHALMLQEILWGLSKWANQFPSVPENGVSV